MYLKEYQLLRVSTTLIDIMMAIIMAETRSC
jgi:hypothetical protein